MMASLVRRLLVIWLCSLPSLALAADFTLTVPVYISNFPPEITGGYVHCQIVAGRVSRDGRTFDYSGEAMVAEGIGNFTLTGGAFTGEVVIAANAFPGRDPTHGTAYSCTLNLRGTVRGLPTVYAGRVVRIGRGAMDFDSRFEPRLPTQGDAILMILENIP